MIDESDLLATVPIRAKGRHFGVLFVKRDRAKKPTWLSYFGDETELDSLDIRSRTASAVLLVKRGQRHFAITFGYGRHLIRDGAIEPRFGLRVALNAVEPSRLRSVDHSRLDTVPRITREQLGKAAGLDQFGLDVERDMLRMLTGTPSDQSLGTTISGSDQLAVMGRIPLDELGNQLDRYAELASRDAYRDCG